MENKTFDMLVELVEFKIKKKKIPIIDVQCVLENGYLLLSDKST